MFCFFHFFRYSDSSSFQYAFFVNFHIYYLCWSMIYFSLINCYFDALHAPFHNCKYFDNFFISDIIALKYIYYEVFLFYFILFYFIGQFIYFVRVLGIPVIGLVPPPQTDQRVCCLLFFKLKHLICLPNIVRKWNKFKLSDFFCFRFIYLFTYLFLC